MNIAALNPFNKTKTEGDTLGTLYELFQQYEALKDTLIGRVTKSDIDSFVRRNQRNYDVLTARMQELSRRFFEFGEDGKMKIAVQDQHVNKKGFRVKSKTAHKPDPRPRPVLLTGKTMDEYNKLFSELMSEPCQIL